MTGLIPIVFIDHDGEQFKDNLQLQEEIQAGKFPIYRAYSRQQNKTFALKFFPKNDKQGEPSYRKESIVQSLCHPNIMTRVNTACFMKSYHVVVNEFYTKGDFITITEEGAIDSEVVCRTYFHQLIRGIEYLHSNNIAHLDIKLENLMLGDDYQLKIIDFDQAQSLDEEVPKQFGTCNYRAPEALNQSCQDLIKADIYSIGMTLFAFFSGQTLFFEEKEPGLRNHHLSDYFYLFNQSFWKLRRPEVKRPISDSFIELLNGMLEYDPSKRWSVAQIKESEWYNESTIIDHETLREEMNLEFL